jgi:hypothetical protein
MKKRLSSVADHLHRYKKVNLGQNGKDYFVYKCMKPVCSHYLPLNLAEGKMCECNRCGEPMIISKATLNGSSNRPMTKPHCVGCIKRRKVNTEEVDAIAAFLEENK